MTRVRVIPAVRLPRGLNEFDYAVPDDMNETCLPGTFVAMPFRGRRIAGLIVSRSDEEVEKLKSIERILPLAFLSWDEQRHYIEWFARHYCVSKATALKTLFPAFPAAFLSRGAMKKRVSKKTSTFEPFWNISDVPIPRLGKKPVLCMPSSIQERYGLVIALLKKNVKNKKNAVIFFPTIHECELFEPYARQAGGEHVVVLHSDLTPTTLFARWTSLFDETPRCILSTRIGVGIPLHNIGTVVIDSSERSEHNQYDLNPRFDVRDCAGKIAEQCDARLISVSSAPRLEDYAQLESGSISRRGLAQFRACPPRAGTNLCLTPFPVPAPFSPIIVNMRDEIRARGRGYISEPLVEHIDATLENNKGVFLFLNRTGASRMITCRDCGHVFSCPICGEPASSRTTLLICTRCEKQEPLPSRCPSCRSVRFHFIALGTEKIAELLRAQFPDVTVREITQKNSSSELLASVDYSSTIIIGTSYLPFAYPEHFHDCGLIGILSADPLVSLSDFRAEERHVQILFHFASLARSVNAQLILQTFSPEHKGVKALVAGDYSVYATIALAERQSHGWPPTTHLIRLRLNHPNPFLSSPRPRGSSEEIIRCIAQECTAHGLTIRSKNEREILLSFPQQSLQKNELPESLQRYLMSIPAEWLIDIDPVVL